eukprot:171977-Chlamydomonas_euryale.AAC.1
MRTCTHEEGWGLQQRAVQGCQLRGPLPFNPHTPCHGARPAAPSSALSSGPPDPCPPALPTPDLWSNLTLSCWPSRPLSSSPADPRPPALPTSVLRSSRPLSSSPADLCPPALPNPVLHPCPPLTSGPPYPCPLALPTLSAHLTRLRTQQTALVTDYVDESDTLAPIQRTQLDELEQVRRVAVQRRCHSGAQKEGGGVAASVCSALRLQKHTRPRPVHRRRPDLRGRALPELRGRASPNFAAAPPRPSRPRRLDLRGGAALTFAAACGCSALPVPTPHASRLTPHVLTPRASQLTVAVYGLL